MHILTIIRAVVVYVIISLLSHDLTQAQQPEVTTQRTRQMTDAAATFKAAKNAYFSFAAQVATREDAVDDSMVPHIVVIYLQVPKRAKLS